MEKISSSKIKLADLRFYEDGLGIELTDSQSRGILIDFLGNENYINPFILEESYPVFKRTLGTNFTGDGESFGTKLLHVSNSLATGPCWVLDRTDFAGVIGKDEVTVDELEEFVLKSPEFFKDRMSVVQRRVADGDDSSMMQEIIEKDEKAIAAMHDFFNEREIGYQKVKED